MTNAPAPTDQRLGVIGTGRVAQALLMALAPHFALPPMIWGRSPDAVTYAIARAKTGVSTPLSDLTAQSTTLVIAVSDDAIPTIVATLAAHDYPQSPLIFHVSGGSGVALLTPLHQQGARIAAIHPAMTFIGHPEAEVARMIGAPFAITAPDDTTLNAAAQIVQSIGGLPIVIAEDKRALYHAALCHAANHLVTLQSGAMEILQAAGVPDPGALLRPLVNAACDNVLTHGFQTLSGPMLRGDAQTIARHLTDIAAYAPDQLFAYRTMAQATLDMLEQQGISHPDARALLQE